MMQNFHAASCIFVAVSYSSLLPIPHRVLPDTAFISPTLLFPAFSAQWNLFMRPHQSVGGGLRHWSLPRKVWQIFHFALAERGVCSDLAPRSRCPKRQATPKLLALFWGNEDCLPHPCRRHFPHLALERVVARTSPLPFLSSQTSAHFSTGVCTGDAVQLVWKASGWRMRTSIARVPQKACAHAGNIKFRFESRNLKCLGQGAGGFRPRDSLAA